MQKNFLDYEELGITTLYDRIYLEGLKDRHIILNDEIDSSLYETVVMAIKKMNLEDEKANIPMSERKPINLFVNSYGGSVYDGFAIINAILSSKTPVHTHCDGYVMSMGLAIFIAGHFRFCGKYSNFMYHEVSTMSFGKNTEIEEVTKENKRLQKMYDSLVTERTGLKQNQLDRVKRGKKDWFFGSSEAVEYGIVHELV
jgi:ATP-dependent Clp protease protease subunit